MQRAPSASDNFMQRLHTNLVLLLAVVLVGCQSGPSGPGVPTSAPPPDIIVPQLPPGQRTQGILIHLGQPPAARLRSLLSAVAVESDGHVWAIARVDLDNHAQQIAVEAALRAGATLTQYLP